MIALIDLRADDYWVIATAICCNVSCALLGCFLVLRRMSLLGDAISHGILPGLALAFLWTGSRAPMGMLLGAMAVGILTAVFSQGLTAWGRVPEDAAMGVVFSTLFALGVVLITRAASSIDLDPGCVLYGLIEHVPLDMVTVAGIDVPRATILLAGVLVAVTFMIVVFYKELLIVSFDPFLATTSGIPAVAVHYGLMAAVAATTVASFESVGSILVVAMLIAPGAAAHMLTDRLHRMLLIAALVGVIAAVVGYLLALRWNTSVAGMMAVVSGVEVALAVLFSPRYGVASKFAHNQALALRIVREDVLGMLYRWQEAGRTTGLMAPDVRAAVGAPLLARWALRSLVGGRRLSCDAEGHLMLTPLGSDEARRLVRSHRLWEAYLAKHFNLPLDHLHAPAERMEHFVTAGMQSALREESGDADPHGRAIPS